MGRGTQSNKDHQGLSDLHGTLRMPVFTDSHAVTVQWKAYQVSAVLLHRGDRTSSGHYQALLRDKNEPCFLTDDGQPATLQSSASMQQHRHGAYVLFCIAEMEL